MEQSPVRLGRMLFTLVDPSPGFEVAYNRWYERDHFYAGCMIGPYLFAGRRFVATRELKDLRFPKDSPFAVPVDAGSYLSIYWTLAGHEDEHFSWARRQVVSLYQDGRGFDERTHAHTGLYQLAASRSADPDGVPVELALDHGFEGLAVVVIEPVGAEPDPAFGGDLVGGPLSFVVDARGVELVASFAVYLDPVVAGGFRPPMSMGSPGGSPDRVVSLCFLNVDPVGAWPGIERAAGQIEATGSARVSFAAPFVPTIVGTDTYTDQLW